MVGTIADQKLLSDTELRLRAQIIEASGFGVPFWQMGYWMRQCGIPDSPPFGAETREFLAEYCGTTLNEIIAEVGKEIGPLSARVAELLRHAARSRRDETSTIGGENGICGQSAEHLPTGQPCTNGSPSKGIANNCSAFDRLPKCHRKAYSLYLDAKSRSQELGDDPIDREVYHWLKQNADEQLPKEKTFLRYISAARRAAGQPKKSPRAGRPTTGSVARRGEV